VRPQPSEPKTAKSKEANEHGDLKCFARLRVASEHDPFGAFQPAATFRRSPPVGSLKAKPV